MHVEMAAFGGRCAEPTSRERTRTGVCTYKYDVFFSSSLPAGLDGVDSVGNTSSNCVRAWDSDYSLKLGSRWQLAYCHESNDIWVCMYKHIKDVSRCMCIDFNPHVLE
jgi:hypothetical protein